MSHHHNTASAQLFKGGNQKQPKALTKEMLRYFEQIEQLMHQKEFTTHDINLMIDFFEFFCHYGFSDISSQIRIFCKKNFSKFLLKASLWEGLLLAQHFHAFLRLSAYGSKTLMAPLNVELSAYACMPFYMWAKAKFIEQNINPIQFNKGQNYIFIAKVASVVSNYSPGKMVYTYCKSFLDHGHAITIIPYLGLDDKFKNLQKKYPHLNVCKPLIKTLPQELVHSSSNDHHVLTSDYNKYFFLEMIKIINDEKPTAIFTEREFGPSALLSMIGCNVPMIYFSPGFYNVPWYDKIGLPRPLQPQAERDCIRIQDCFNIPMYLDMELLVPDIGKSLQDNAIKKLKINPNDFIFGMLARKQKMGLEYCKLCRKILDAIPNAKLILAGAGDDRLIFQVLKDDIAKKRAIILKNQNAHLLGYLFDVGLETFPVGAGFAIMELMAKGKPVLSLSLATVTIETGYKQMRDPDNLFITEYALIERMVELANSKDLYQKMAKKAKTIIQKNVDSKGFYRIVEEQIALIKNQRNK
ncbi:MAG: hypothetical protein AAF403_05965 [Pseudomonadota bacterium]